MRVLSLRRPALPALAALLSTIGLLLCATAARAAPGTVSLNGITVTVSNTTPAPGDTITVTESYTTNPENDEAAGASLGFGDQFNGTAAVNLADLSYVANSCTGDFTACTYDPGDAKAFRAKVPPGDVGTISGTARFTVASTATDGEPISFFGFQEDQLPNDRGFVTETGPETDLTVTTPTADLGVSLSATAAGLLTSHVNYDAAITDNGPAAATSATITTQLASDATSIASTTCTYASTTDKVTCPIGSLANGATTHATFTAYFGLLTIGLPLNATATRTASSPVDPNAANDTDGAACTALTALLITC